MTLTTEQVHTVEVDPNRPDVQAKAERIVRVLVDSFGVGFAIATLIVATEYVFSVILHAETPMPEGNIAMAERLLTSLKANVMKHADCAKTINGVKKKQAVH